jgi:hypothetical protein
VRMLSPSGPNSGGRRRISGAGLNHLTQLHKFEFLLSANGPAARRYFNAGARCNPPVSCGRSALETEPVVTPALLILPRPPFVKPYVRKRADKGAVAARGRLFWIHE